MIEIETTIKDGLPVIASGEVQRAEPDVGLMGPFVEDLEVKFLSGHPVPFELSDEDEQHVINAIVEAYSEPPSDY